MTVNTSISFTPGEFYFEWYDGNVVAFNVSINKEGRAEGEADGRTYNIIALLRKKFFKGKDAATAADELEENLDTIQPLYDLIKQYPEESDEDILARYKECCKTDDSQDQ